MRVDTETKSVYSVGWNNYEDICQQNDIMVKKKLCCGREEYRNVNCRAQKIKLIVYHSKKEIQYNNLCLLSMVILSRQVAEVESKSLRDWYSRCIRIC